MTGLGSMSLAKAKKVISLLSSRDSFFKYCEVANEYGLPVAPHAHQPLLPTFHKKHAIRAALVRPVRRAVFAVISTGDRPEVNQSIVGPNPIDVIYHERPLPEGYKPCNSMRRIRAVEYPAVLVASIASGSKGLFLSKSLIPGLPATIASKQLSASWKPEQLPGLWIIPQQFAHLIGVERGRIWLISHFRSFLDRWWLGGRMRWNAPLTAFYARFSLEQRVNQS